MGWDFQRREESELCERGKEGQRRRVNLGDFRKIKKERRKRKNELKTTEIKLATCKIVSNYT